MNDLSNAQVLREKHVCREGLLTYLYVPFYLHVEKCRQCIRPNESTFIKNGLACIESTDHSFHFRPDCHCVKYKLYLHKKPCKCAASKLQKIKKWIHSNWILAADSHFSPSARVFEGAEILACFAGDEQKTCIKTSFKWRYLRQANSAEFREYGTIYNETHLHRKEAFLCWKEWQLLHLNTARPSHRICYLNKLHCGCEKCDFATKSTKNKLHWCWVNH